MPRLITESCNNVLTKGAHIPLATPFTGTARTVLGTLQVALNAILLVPSLCATACVSSENPLHIKNVGLPLLEGFEHIGRGLWEMIPAKALLCFVLVLLHTLALIPSAPASIFVNPHDPIHIDNVIKSIKEFAEALVKDVYYPRCACHAAQVKAHELATAHLAAV